MPETADDKPHALVTGGGTGIGLAIARALAAQGHPVTITGRRADVLKAAAEETPGLFPQVMDVASEDSVEAGITAARKARGPILVHVANAGVAEGKSLHKTTLAFWRQMMAVNLDGAFLTIRECLSDMVPANRGRVIAVASMAGLHGLKGAPAYTASKHGMVGLIRALAADHTGKNITFNALCPGYVDTEIVARNVASIAARTGMDDKAALDVMVKANPHGRLIGVDEVAAAAMWLASDAAASVNGQAIEISGGTL